MTANPISISGTVGGEPSARRLPSYAATEHASLGSALNGSMSQRAQSAKNVSAALQRLLEGSPALPVPSDSGMADQLTVSARDMILNRPGEAMSVQADALRSGAIQVQLT